MQRLLAALKQEQNRNKTGVLGLPHKRYLYPYSMLSNYYWFIQKKETFGEINHTKNFSDYELGILKKITSQYFGLFCVILR